LGLLGRRRWGEESENTLVGNPPANTEVKKLEFRAVGKVLKGDVRDVGAGVE